jgi:hypothetical protein
MNSVSIRIGFIELAIFIACITIFPILNLVISTIIAVNFELIHAAGYWILSSLIWIYGCIVLLQMKLDEPIDTIH